jgi:ribonuclease P protein component
VSLRFSTNGSADPPRVAYAIGRRAGSAVDRNRIRRRLRAAVAGRSDDLLPGGAYLFAAEPSVLTLGFAELSSAVAGLLAQVRESQP